MFLLVYKFFNLLIRTNVSGFTMLGKVVTDYISFFTFSIYRNAEELYVM